MPYIFVFLLLSSSAWAQTLTETQTLCSLARVWGFLKYYHPAVATGRYDWDNQLIRLINAYVQRIKGVNNTGYENEKLYAAVQTPDEPYRLLALFRYWNIIQYFYPYKYAIDGNWNNVLTDLIPIFRQATTEQTYQQAIYRLVAHIQDSHGFLLTVDKTRCMRCELGRFWLPFAVKVANNKAIITRVKTDSLLVGHTLRIGTVISHIDSIPIQTHLDRLRPYIAASTEADFLRDVNGLIGLGKTSFVDVTIEQDGRDTTLRINRYPFLTVSKTVLISTNARYPVSAWLRDSVGYINLGKLMSKQVDSTMKSLLNAKAIIFDLRNYPLGTYWLIGRYLTNQPTSTVFAEFTGPNLKFPGLFQPVGTARLPSVTRNKLYTGQVIVLVNEETQSHAEFTAMAFRLVPNVIFVGSPTAGADGNISWVPLPGGYRTAFSGIGVYYPDGRETQRVGIMPDILIEPTVAGIREGRDEVLEKAIELSL